MSQSQSQSSSNTSSSDQINIRVRRQERERLEMLRQRLQARLGPHIQATQRLVLLEALDRLEAHYEKLERDRGRER